MKDDPISFWLEDGVAWVKPSGDGCEANAPKVTEFTKEMTKQGPRRFVVDLGECTGIDEVFMGTLAGIILRLREFKQGNVRILRCPAELDTQLRKIGLDRLLEM